MFLFRFVLLALCLLLSGCTEAPSQEERITPSPEQKTEVKASINPMDEAEPTEVTVAAIQCYSRMGEIDYNRRLLESFIRKAAQSEAKIIVLPEAAISGYMNPGKDITWSIDPTLEGEMDVRPFAEAVPGDSSRYFAALAKELKVYLTIPLIEKSDGMVYNSVLLANPEGKIIAHHRKQALWTPGDGGWCEYGDLPAQVVDTEYGKLGLMICFDLHVMPEKLAAKKADIVLYSVGWYGANTELWYSEYFPRRYVKPHGFHVVAANWCGERTLPAWGGQGFSSIVLKDGKVQNITRQSIDPAIVLGKLPINHSP